MSKNPKFIIVYGPPASGKTLNSAALKTHYCCDYVFDNDFHGLEIRRATGLILLLAWSARVKDPRDRRRMLKAWMSVPVHIAAQALGDRWVKPRGFVSRGLSV